MRAAEYALAECLRSQRQRASSSGAIGKADRILDDLFPAQRAFVLDRGHPDTRRIAVRTPGQAGKSTGVRARLMRTCLTIPGAKALYLALSRGSAKEILWNDLKNANQQYDLRATFNNSDLAMTFSETGREVPSRILLAGADDQKDIEKYRGIPQDEVCVDECKSFPAKLLEELIDEVLQPRINTRNGQLVLAGTPGKILDGPFYHATRVGSPIARPWLDRDRPEWAGKAFEWSFHTWTLADNATTPETAALWARALAFKAARGWTDENPAWRRESLGEWTTDAIGLVYRFDAAKDTWTPGPPSEGNPFGLPEGHVWQYVIGGDLGWSVNDHLAIVALAFSDTCPTLYQVYDYSRPSSDLDERSLVTAIGELLQALIAKLGGYPAGIVFDHAHLGGAITQEVTLRYGIVIESADKKNKNDYIELVNGDFVDGRLKLLAGSVCAREASALQWDDTGLREDKGQANHSTDGLVYGRRKALHFMSTDRVAPPSRAAAIEAERVAAERRTMERERQKRQEPNAVEDFDGDYTTVEFDEGDFFDAV